MKSPLFWVCCLFILTAKGHLEVIDTDYSVKTAISILENGSMRIKASDEDFIKFSINPTEDGLIYSQYGIGLPLLFIPFIIVAKTISILTEVPQSVLTSFFISFYNIPFAIMGLWFIKEILQKLGFEKKQGYATVVVISTCTAYWHYTVIDFSEIIQLSFLLGSINASISNNKNKWRCFSFWFSLLLSIKIAYLVLLPSFIVYGLIESRQIKDRLIKDIFNGASFILPFGIIIGILNYVRFGDFTEFGYGGNPGLGFSLTNFINICPTSIFSLNYGIIPFNPILLSIPLWFIFYKKNQLFSYLITSIIGLWFIIMCSYNYGWGWSWGQRYLFIVIPLIALPVVCLPSIKLSRFGKAIFVGLTLSSSFVQLVSVSTKFHEPLTMKLKTKEKSENLNLEQLPSSFLLFKHKLLDGSSNYPLSIIGGNANDTINVSNYESFRGFNFWPIHALKFLKFDNYVRFAELFLISVIFILQITLLMTFLPNLLKK